MSDIGNYLINQMRMGYSPLVVVTGGQRKGKSTTVIQLSREIYKRIHQQEYPMRDNFLFDVKSFMKMLFGFSELSDDAIDKMTKKDMEKLVRMYKTPAIDEAGYELASTTWWDKFNRAVAVTIQTQAYLANCYFVILPHLKDLAPALRRLMNVQINCQRKGFNRWWIYNQRYHNDEGAKARPSRLWMGHFTVADLPEAIRKEWLVWERENKTRIMKELLETLDDDEENEETKYLLE